MTPQSPHLGCQIIKNAKGVNKHVKAKLAKFKNFRYRNYCINSNQILHNDKDHQMLFMDGPNSCITNLRR